MIQRQLSSGYEFVEKSEVEIQELFKCSTVLAS